MEEERKELKEVRELALQEVGVFSRRYKDLQKDIERQAQVIALTLGDDIDDTNVYSVEISPNNDKTFITSNGTRVGGYLIYDRNNNSLEVQEFEYIDENIATSDVVGYWAFSEIDTDLQIKILEEIIKNYC